MATKYKIIKNVNTILISEYKSYINKTWKPKFKVVLDYQQNKDSIITNRCSKTKLQAHNINNRCEYFTIDLFV